MLGFLGNASPLGVGGGADRLDMHRGWPGEFEGAVRAELWRHRRRSRTRERISRREKMSEDYRIISPARGEPRSRGDVGVCVRVRLSGCPSRRWSRALGARLATELIGHPSAAHLRLNANDLVEGDEIVLDGVEDRDTLGLAAALSRAVNATNRAVVDEVRRPPNQSKREAQAVASRIELGGPGPEAVTDGADDPPCPRCGHAVPVSAGDREAGDQLAVGDRDCPGCGARLVREVQGHADRGWRLAD
jgi:hypothetical protein